MSVAAQPWIKTHTVEYSSDGVTIKAFLARLSSARDPLPAIVILHEWWGLNDHIKDIAQRFAKEGYIALAPDLYSRLGYKVTADAGEAAKLMESLSTQAALRDLNAATAFLKRQACVDGLRIGAVGFCMGGTIALIMAGHNSDLKAVVPFYGKVPPIETFRYLLCAVLYHYGAKDEWVTKQEADRLQQGMAQYGKPGRVHVYPQAGHAFFNDTRPDAYHGASAKLAWERTLRFFREQLR